MGRLYDHTFMIQALHRPFLRKMCPLPNRKRRAYRLVSVLGSAPEPRSLWDSLNYVLTIFTLVSVFKINFIL